MNSSPPTSIRKKGGLQVHQKNLFAVCTRDREDISKLFYSWPINTASRYKIASVVFVVKVVHPDLLPRNKLIPPPQLINKIFNPPFKLRFENQHPVVTLLKEIHQLTVEKRT